MSGKIICAFADYQPLIDGLYRQVRFDLIEKVFRG